MVPKQYKAPVKKLIPMRIITKTEELPQMKPFLLFLFASKRYNKNIIVKEVTIIEITAKKSYLAIAHDTKSGSKCRLLALLFKLEINCNLVIIIPDTPTIERTDDNIIKHFFIASLFLKLIMQLITAIITSPIPTGDIEIFI